jgi:uncharacterized secreted repeat protein (TIGR03808 family)
MDPQRRNLLAWSGAASAWGAASTLSATAATMPQHAAATTAPISALGLDAGQMGVRAGSADDQTAPLQRAIDRAATARVPLALAPGVYRAGALHLPPGAQLVGIRGATRLMFTGGAAFIAADHAEQIILTGLIFDGGGRPLPPNQGLVHIEQASAVRIADCAILGSGGHGIRFAAVAGEVTGSTIDDAADVALLSSDALGLTISHNTITNAGNNGIQIIRADQSHDGTLVLDNRIENIRNREGGSGQFGNAVNAHRAGDVMVRGNIIRHCAFSAIRGNSASNIQIVGNTVHDTGEVALYSEFSFEGAIIANNIVDGAQTGISVANFNEGGRLAVVQGNILRNLAPRIPNPSPDDLWGVGIYVEADTTVNGNVVENAQAAGIAIGWGSYLRDVAVTGNVVRKSPIGIAVSVVPGAGATLISGNVVSGFRRGAIIGMDHARPITGELAKDGPSLYANLSISGNRLG